MTREVTAGRRPVLRRTRLLLIAALPFAFAAPSISSAAEQRSIRDTIGETKPWPAPIGHRQPRTADVLPLLEVRSGNDDDAALDRRLQICRGC
jgi:hypothetical protein